MKSRTFFIIGILVAVALAVVVSQFASSDPDGLEYGAEQEGFSDTATEGATSDSPLADYGGDDPWSKGVAGLAGVAATLAIGYAVFWLARRTGGVDQTQGSTLGSSGAHRDRNDPQNRG